MSVTYFAWVDATETFGAEHHRFDEDVFSWAVEHQEGEFATLTVDIPNPRIGLLAPGRKTWVFLSVQEGATVTLIFAGRLIATPSNLVGEDWTLTFSGRPVDYAVAKQRVAEGLKAGPNYDPLFLGEAKRDDPDTILQGYSAAWHINRTTGEVTVSDVLEGEDGTETFTEDETPYDSVKLTIDRPPLTEALVEMDVAWGQSWSDYVNLGTWTFDSYAGDGILQDWPKALGSLGDGWTAVLATAVDAYHVDKAPTLTKSFQWTNTAKKHANGDSMSIESSSSAPDLPNGYISRRITYAAQNGFIDPFATDSEGDPAPINIPESYTEQSSYVPKWRVRTALVARYDAKRDRRERLRITVTSDLQAIVTDDATAPDSETISIGSAQVDQPILDVKNWSSVAGTAVTLGQIIFPDVGTASTAQIATTAGTAGTTPPAFSDVAGATTADGTAVWTSLGSTSIATAPDWKASAYTPLGSVIRPDRPLSIPYAWLVQQGLLEVPKTGTNVNLGTLVSSGGTYQQCSLSGTTGVTTPAFSGTPGTVTTDGSAHWTSLGTDLPLGSVYFIATTAGTSGAALPGFSNTLGTTTTDGSVVWTSLGTADVPIGGYPGHTGRNAFFPTDRGLQAIEYGIARARALLRLRARVVQITWETTFDRALALSCRKNATLEDRRLPGGTATGKIVGYTISADGATGTLKGSVTIGCAIGNGGTLSTSAGTPSYVATGYVADGYQYTTATITSGPDIAYTPPPIAPNSDDLNFPLTRGDAVQYELVHGTLAAQATAVTNALQAAATAAKQQALVPDYLVQFQQQQDNAKSTEERVRDALKTVPIWLELELADVHGGPFAAEYVIATSPLVIPQSIDLEAASLP